MGGIDGICTETGQHSGTTTCVACGANRLPCCAGDLPGETGHCDSDSAMGLCLEQSFGVFCARCGIENFPCCALGARCLLSAFVCVQPRACFRSACVVEGMFDATTLADVDGTMCKVRMIGTL